MTRTTKTACFASVSVTYCCLRSCPETQQLKTTMICNFLPIFGLISWFLCCFHLCSFMLLHPKEKLAGVGFSCNISSILASLWVSFVIQETQSGWTSRDMTSTLQGMQGLRSCTVISTTFHWSKKDPRPDSKGEKYRSHLWMGRAATAHLY